jgi:DNA-binding NtrC family response regulator
MFFGGMSVNKITKNSLSEENKFEKLKESHDDVLIIGPSGAGKGYLAKLLQTKSKTRAGKNFIHINSASINSTIFESELFGHIKGSFTGAFQDKEGYCCKVKDGDLFLDEIGDLPLELQAKLLVLISDRIYMPVGSCETKIFYGRIIAATNKNLKKEVSQGRFREDLYYRLSNFILNVKPLCEQKDKISELIKLFLKEENSNLMFDKSAFKYLSIQKWNGNIRQLKSIIKRIIRYDSDKKTIKKEDIVPYLEEENYLENENGNIFEEKEISGLIKILFDKINGNLHILIKLFLEYALKLNGQNITATAQSIDIGRKTLERMLKKYNISRIG